MNGDIAIKLNVNPAHRKRNIPDTAKYEKKLKAILRELKRQKSVIVESIVEDGWHTIIAKAAEVLPVKRSARKKASRAKEYSEPHGGANLPPEKPSPAPVIVTARDTLADDLEAIPPETAQVEGSGAGGLVIAQYSEKAVIITGNTYPHSARIKACVPKSHGLWHRGARGWLFSKKHEPALRVALADILAA